MEQLSKTLRGVDIGYTVLNPEASETMVFLHGFTGSTRTWTSTIEHLPKSVRCIAVDLIGHGNTAAPQKPERYGMKEQLLDLHGLFTELQLSNFTLVGYSMGGRIALAYALHYPEQIKHLMLESASPGLPTEAEQKSRQMADESLAKRIELEGLTAFIDFWQDIPLFQSQQTLPESTKQDIREERMQQSVSGLVNSLKGIGTGSQPSYWPLLHQLGMPVTLVTGELDEKFDNIAKQMKNNMPNAEHIQVSACGHALHVENPVQFATIIKEQMNKFF